MGYADRFVMLIVCPSCASEYNLDPGRIGPKGREVRCASCRTAWFVRQDGRAPAAPAPPGPGRSRGRPKPQARKGRPGAARERLAIAALLVACIGIAASVALRDKVVRAVPGSATLFGAMGLPVNVVGLRLDDVSSSLGEEGGAKVLLVEGTIAAQADREVAVPRLAYTIEGADGAVLYTWTSRPPVDRVGPSEPVRFTARLASPPPEGRRVVIGFVQPKDAADVASR